MTGLSDTIEKTAASGLMIGAAVRNTALGEHREVRTCYPMLARAILAGVMWTDIPDPHTPMGAHGIGEIGITGVGAAVANAVFNATGGRVRHLPITLDKLL